LASNVAIIAKSLASQIFPLLSSKENLFSEDLEVSKTFLRSILGQICSHARSQQLLLTTQRGGLRSTYVVPPFLSTLDQVLKKFTKKTELHHFTLDKREPELVFYEPFSTTMNVYNVKPAVFDLFLSLIIAVYLCLLYLICVNIDGIVSAAKSTKSKLVSNNKTKQQ
jgi:hypothetical protein